MAGGSFKQAWGAFKTAMRFGGNPYSSHWVGQWGSPGAFNFAANAGDPADNSIVSATLGWIGRTYPEAPIRVYRETPDGEDIVPGHPCAALLKRPNPFYSGAQMWTPLLMSYILDGNAYLIKERTNGGDVLALWYVPHWTMEPRWPSDGSQFISHYNYKVDNLTIRYEVADVIHLPNGRDPRNMRKGLSPLKAALREIYTDNEITRYESALLRNRGTPSAFISPGSPEGTMTEAEAIFVRQQYLERTTGENQGKPIVSLAAIKVDTPSFSPADMNLRDMRRTPEERISALIGIPAIVVGLGAGLERCIIGTMRIATPDRGPVAVQNIEPGDTVWAMQNNRIEACVVTWAGKTGHRDVFTVKTPNRTITATDNHPFLVRRVEKVSAPMADHRYSPEKRYSLEWVPLADLAVGDYIVSAAQLPDVGKTVLPDGTEATVPMLEWFGAFVGDGSYTGGEKDIGITMSIPKTDRVRAYYEPLTATLFTKYAGGGVRMGRRITDGTTEEMVARWEAGESYRAIARDYSIHNASVRDRIQTVINPSPAKSAPVFIQQEVRYGFRISSASGSRWLRSLGFLRGARLKRIPPWVFTLTEELRLAFLRGLLDTDGSVDKRGLAKFAFASEELTHDAWHLALSCGLRVCNVAHGQIMAKRLPNAGLQEHYEYWTFTITNAEDVQWVGTHDAKYQAYLDATKPTFRRGVAGGHPKSVDILPEGCVFTKVQAIIPAGTEDVYDLTIDGAHNFIAQGLVIHNSTFANYQQSREAAYESFLMPVQASIDEELTTQLLADFDTDPSLRVGHDYSDVRVLQPDMDKIYDRVEKVFAASIIDRATAKRELKLDVKSEDEGIYYLGRGGSFVDGTLTEVGPAVDPLLQAGITLPGISGELPPSATPVAIPAAVQPKNGAALVPAKPTNGSSKTPVPAKR